MQNENVTSAELAVIIPTFKERENIATLIKSLNKVLDGICWEAVFVDDDSPDGTADEIRKIGKQDPRIRCLHRIGRRGLSSACIEGMLSTSADYVAVMDADMQHDESLLPKMLEQLKTQPLDVAIGSRYVEGGGFGEWEAKRVSISRFATRLSRMVLKADLTDPMSGFFMLRRDAFMQSTRRLSGIGFKILVDLFASSPKPYSYVELPYEFRTRTAGESKLDNLVAWDYGMLLLDKLVGHIIPIRFISFSLIGGLGVIVHMLVLAFFFKAMAMTFIISQTIATITAMTFNYTLNNLLTYKDMQLHGWRWFKGWFTFSLACSIGAMANVGVASYIYDMQFFWGLAALAGILVGVLWNYVITMLFTWKPGKSS